MDLQEIPLGNADFSWFTDGSYLKRDNGKYCAGYIITNPFDVGATSLPMATLAQQAELHTGLDFSPGQNCQYLY